MPVDLAAIADRTHTALLTCECMNGVIGSSSVLPQLAEAATTSVIPNGARLVRGARAAGVPVIHCVVGRRSDDRGSNRNARLFMAMMDTEPKLVLGGPMTDIVPEIGREDSDFVVGRIQGLGPFAGTELDNVLRNLGMKTVVAIGVSVNVALQNLTMDAVNLGYQVVLPRDAVAGVPADYADAVLDNTLSLLATLTTTDKLLETWS